MRTGTSAPSVRLARFLFLAAFSAVALAAAARPADTATHSVWRITNVPVPFYLVGSIHTLEGKDYPLAPVYLTALKDSQRLLFEYDPRKRDEFDRKFGAAARYPTGQDLRNNLHLTTLHALVKDLAQSRTRFDDIRNYRPWAIAYTLWRRQGLRAVFRTYGVDSYLSYHARRLGKEVGGLETVDEHVAFWRDMLELDGELLLLGTLERGSKLSDHFDETRAAWKRGDLAALCARRERAQGVNLRMARRLIDQRNFRWIPRIEAAIKSGKATAIVAGAIHFCGSNGVIALLEERGYQIVQL